ncbi:unnamed protein product [marine sediment metagenome]|uniref:Phage head morphogenesis domain-containing protein n=1 Tax=marine sediment metagenome TaxID=412755 RepID=X0TGN6_9ZZZZ
MRPVFMKALETQIQPLYEAINGTSNISHIEVPQLDPGPIKGAYKQLYMATAFEFAKFDRRQAKSMRGVEILKDEDAIIEDLILQAIDGYLITDMGTTITAIGDTSEVLLKNLLDKLIPEIMESGIGGGAAQTALRDRIKSEWHRARYFRTERIVRTEVNRAANFGSLKGVQSTEFPHNKVWLAAFTAGSRASHMDADSQRVDQYEAFSVDGEDLQYPTDPGGSAGNTINCLCSLTYETK